MPRAGMPTGARTGSALVGRRGACPHDDRTLRAAFALLGKVLPQATEFVDSHFGDKLGEQHRVLGAEILELGRREGVPLPSLERLLG